MKAAVIARPGELPVYTGFQDPAPVDGMQIVEVTAAALTNLTKGRASGSHYSAENQYPLVPGVDGTGITSDGKRVYFVMPEAPFGAMADQTLVDPRRTIALPDALDDVTAAAIANPGMSCWAAMVERAQLRPGETVLVNGATGSAGSVAVQLAKQLGAAKVIVTGRNAAELEALRQVGADTVLPFHLAADDPEGAEQLERGLIAEFQHGIDVVIDYLWGRSAHSIIAAIAKGVEDAHPVRFVQVGEAAGESTVALPAAALRSSAIQLMGSGLKSVPMAKLLEAIRHTFDLAAQGNLQLATKAVPLSTVAETWNAPGKPRLVYTTR